MRTQHFLKFQSQIREKGGFLLTILKQKSIHRPKSHFLCLLILICDLLSFNANLKKQKCRHEDK